MIPKEHEFFREVTLRICSSLDIETALGHCFDYIKAFFPVDEMSLHTYDVDTGVISTMATATLKGATLFKMPRMVKISQESMEDLRNVNQPVVKVINRPENDPVTREMGKAYGKPDSSVLTMRLVIGGKRIGALTLRADGTDRYTEEHVRQVAALNDPFGLALSNSLRYQEVVRLKEMLSDDNRYLHSELRHLSGGEIIGSDFGLRGVMEMVSQVAPLSSPVLLLGETGVGKEVIANAIHTLSPRREGPFIKVNCGAIPESLIDSELFGHERGAFTGAISQKRGRFERADRGTIFLDEIGELPPHAQVRLLRVLQEKEIERVEGSKPIKVDIRVVAATNRDLEGMTQSGQFRQDLWFRLNVFPLLVPPLRERREDIPALVHYFIDRKSREMGIRSYLKLASGALEKLIRYGWPGNVRELQNVIERALILRKGDVLNIDDAGINTPKDEKLKAPVTESKSVRFAEVAAHHIREVLKTSGGRVEGEGGAAELLGIHPSTLRNRMKKLGIPYGRKRP